MSDLYIMQNHLGFIKIGRSTNVQARKKSLERADQCMIAIVAVVPKAGHLEERILVDLNGQRVLGEWIAGDQHSRNLVSASVHLAARSLRRKSPLLSWRYELADDETANAWLDQCEKSRILAGIQKKFDRCIRDMRRAGMPIDIDSYRFCDGLLCGLISDRMYFVEADEAGEAQYTIYPDDLDQRRSLPRFTRDINAALQLWPDEDRPESWTGSAWDCCIAGLKARRARLR